MEFSTSIQTTEKSYFPTIRRCLSAVPGALLLLTSIFSVAHADSDLAPFVAEYTAENDYITGGKATLSLRKNSTDTFDFVLQTKPTGIFKWSGKGNIREHAELLSLNAPFEATSYRYKDKGQPDRNYVIDFDRPDGSFQINSDGESATYPLPEGTLDRLSVTLVILNQLQKNADFKRLDAKILNGNTAQEIVFTHQGIESVHTEIGKLTAVRIAKERVASNRETTIWLAEMKGTSQVVPVKIEQFKRGKLTMRLILTKFSALE